ncbi:hypothetical protein ZORO111903_16550 [Zobellia roscoffensis]
MQKISTIRVSGIQTLAPFYTIKIKYDDTKHFKTDYRNLDYRFS